MCKHSLKLGSKVGQTLDEGGLMALIVNEASKPRLNLQMEQCYPNGCLVGREEYAGVAGFLLEVILTMGLMMSPSQPVGGRHYSARHPLRVMFWASGGTPYSFRLRMRGGARGRGGMLIFRQTGSKSPGPGRCGSINQVAVVCRWLEPYAISFWQQGGRDHRRRRLFFCPSVSPLSFLVHSPLHI